MDDYFFPLLLPRWKFQVGFNNCLAFAWVLGISTLVLMIGSWGLYPLSSNSGQLHIFQSPFMHACFMTILLMFTYCAVELLDCSVGFSTQCESEYIQFFFSFTILSFPSHFYLPLFIFLSPLSHPFDTSYLCLPQFQLSLKYMDSNSIITSPLSYFPPHNLFQHWLKMSL